MMLMGALESAASSKCSGARWRRVGGDYCPARFVGRWRRSVCQKVRLLRYGVAVSHRRSKRAQPIGDTGRLPKLGSGFVPLASWNRGLRQSCTCTTAMPGMCMLFRARSAGIMCCLHDRFTPTMGQPTMAQPEFAWRIDTTARATALQSVYQSPRVNVPDGTVRSPPQRILRDSSNTGVRR